MEPSALSKEAKLVLVAMARLLVQADAVLSPEEDALAERLSTAIGPVVFSRLAAYAKTHIKDREHLQPFLDAVTDPEERKAVLGQLVDMAFSDEVDAGEMALIDWLRKTWSIDE